MAPHLGVADPENPPRARGGGPDGRGGGPSGIRTSPPREADPRAIAVPPARLRRQPLPRRPGRCVDVPDPRGRLPAAGTSLPAFVVARDGLYLRKRSLLGVSQTKVERSRPPAGGPEFVDYALPKVPADLMARVVGFFRAVYRAHRTEAPSCCSGVTGASTSSCRPRRSRRSRSSFDVDGPATACRIARRRVDAQPRCLWRLREHDRRGRRGGARRAPRRRRRLRPAPDRMPRPSSWTGSASPQDRLALRAASTDRRAAGGLAGQGHSSLPPPTAARARASRSGSIGAGAGPGTRCTGPAAGARRRDRSGGRPRRLARARLSHWLVPGHRVEPEGGGDDA